MGKRVIMGRKTFDSLPGPLKGREVSVATRNPEGLLNIDITFRWIDKTGQMVGVITDLEKELKQTRERDGVTIIAGGGEIYRAALPYVDEIYLSVFREPVEGKTTFPYPSPDEWECVNTDNATGNNATFPFTIYHYKRYSRKTRLYRTVRRECRAVVKSFGSIFTRLRN